MENKLGKKHLKELRKIYINTTPKNRLKVANDRVKYPTCKVNIFLVKASLVEAFARAILFNSFIERKITKQDAYKKIKNKNALDLVKEICREKGLDPNKLFDKDIWQDFEWIPEYRNLLTHECTFLRAEFSDKLICSIDKVMSKLEELTQ